MVDIFVMLVSHWLLLVSFSSVLSTQQQLFLHNLDLNRK